MNYKLLSEKQEELIDVYKHDPKLMNDADFLIWNANRERLESEIASLQSEEPTAMEMIKEVFEPIQLGENEVVNQALELASKKAGKEKKDKYTDTEADGYVFCGKCGKMR